MISRYSVKRPYTVVVAVVLVIILGGCVIFKYEDRSASGYDIALCNCYDYVPGSKPGGGRVDGHQACGTGNGNH